MEQLILHLIGDYLTQTDWMAKNKTNNLYIAFLHSFIYTLPFLLLSRSIIILSIIFITHGLIDRYRLAKYIIFIKNKVTNLGFKWADCSQTGYHKDNPIWMSVWLMIIADNTLHLTINYIALLYK